MDFKQAQLADLLKGNWARFHADDACPAMIIKYVGDQASALLEVTAGGEIGFKHGALSSEAADTAVVASTGIIDTNGAASNTMGEVVDIINASGNWEAKLLGALRADSADDTLLVRAEAACSLTTGTILYWDTSAALHQTVCASEVLRKGPVSSVEGDISKADTNVVHSVKGIVCTNTFASGTSKISIYDGETKIWEFAGGATTVEQKTEFYPDKVSGTMGNKVLVRVTGSAACTGTIGAFFESINFVNP